MIFCRSTLKHVGSVRVQIMTNKHWKKVPDKNFVAGTVLMDLPKAFPFDFVLYDFLIAKVHAYSSSEKNVTFICSHLKNQKQNLKIDNVLSYFYLYYLECVRTRYWD